MKQLSPLEGFVLSLGHSARRHRLQRSLKPEGALVPLNLNWLDVMAELDPGMIDWNDEHLFTLS